MLTLISLLSIAQAEDTTVNAPYVPEVEEQSNNGQKKQGGNGNGKGKGNGKGGNGKGKGQGQGKGKGQGNGQGKKTPQKGQGNGNGAKKPAGAGQKGPQGKGNVKWKKYKEEKNIIFRPEFGMTSLNLDTEDQAVNGLSVGLSVGNEKTKRLKAANVGVYNRTRLYGSAGMGASMNSYDFRMGSVLGVKVLNAELEAGLDLLRHMANSGQTDGVDFAASNGFGVPVQALIISDLVKVKVGVEPRWYFDGQPRTPVVDWASHPSTESLPLAPIGDEFAWTVGFRSGFFGLSYEQLLMNGGVQHTVLFGLQR
jgi:hypothetical protein